MNYQELAQSLGPRLLQPCAEGWACDLARSQFGTTRVALVDVLPKGLLKVRARNGSLGQLCANTVQQQYARKRRQRNIIVKARQVGMTTYIAARYFLCTLLRPGTVTLQVAHTQESAQQIFRIVRRFYETLQMDLQRKVITDRATLRELAFAETDSRYVVDTAGNARVGRGLTIHNLHASEVAFWPGEPRETMASLLAAVAPGGMVDVESTPNGVGGYFHSEWVRAQRAEPGAMVPHFFPWWLEPQYKREWEGPRGDSISEEERRLMERHRLTREQIQFRRWIRAAFGDLAPQEYAETAATCFLASGRPVFETAVIAKRIGELPESIDARDNGALLTWFAPEPQRNYIIGADVAEGIGSGDYSAATVIDAMSGLQCAELLARWPIWKFAQELDRLGRSFNQALIAVERNNHGHAVLHALRHQLRYPRLYRHRGLGSAADSAADGWPMNAQTKPEAIQCLAQMLSEAPEAFNSARLLEQCRSFCWTDSGGMAASGRGASSSDASGHDDLVIAMAIAVAVRAKLPQPELRATPSD